MTEQRSLPIPSWGREGGFFSFGVNRPQLAGSASQRDQLVEIVHRYAMAYDERDLAVLRSVFTDGAVWQGIIQGESIPAVEGGQQIVDWLAEIMETQHDQRRHLVLNPAIESVDDRSARLVSYVVVTSAANGAASIATTGFYDITFAREGERWLIDRFIAGFDLGF